MDDVLFEPMDISDLAGDLLGLDPATLASMGGRSREVTGEPSSELLWAGLNNFARKMLTGYLALADVDGAAVRLRDETSAHANGWPNARTANQAMLLI